MNPILRHVDKAEMHLRLASHHLAEACALMQAIDAPPAEPETIWEGSFSDLLALLKWYAQTHREFTNERFQREASGRIVTSALQTVFFKARRKGWIESRGGKPAIYRSLIYTEAA